MRIACCIFAYEITKGIKSIGPLGLIKRNSRAKPFLLEQIDSVRDIFGGVDFYIVTGFENKKIQNILPQKKYIKTIYNKKYETKNHGSAIKLFGDTVKNNIEKYDGYLILEQNTLFKKIHNKHKKHSWISTTKKNDHHKDSLNVSSVDKYVRYLFYQTRGNFWCHNLYLTSQDFKHIISTSSEFHENMFLFEIINFLIETQGIKILENQISLVKDHIYFTYPKNK